MDDTEFELLETILYDPPSGFFLLNQHLERLIKSALYFSENSKSKVFKNCTSSEFGSVVEKELQQSVEKLGKEVRLTVNKDGIIKVASTVLPNSSSSVTPEPLKIVLDKKYTSSDNIFLRHKTTNRKAYDDAKIRAGLPLLPGPNKTKDNEIFDVLMYNENNEITECTISNIAVESRDQRWETPQIECGLLPGVMRAYLMNIDEITPSVITIEDLKIAQQEGRRIKCFNSVRKEFEVVLVEQ
ncbi:12686_t:CDS:2 [Acaulospora morrowiae]|uniref:12686_t:CDS:1 n=1 Tax=Acaulospora morrowiae TaxID=94023 RepID=A0A9N9AQ48_9GLOM|nr:12686_t:CDS:2 [Acaulospora morrowiae]